MKSTLFKKTFGALVIALSTAVIFCAGCGSASQRAEAKSRESFRNTDPLRVRITPALEKRIRVQPAGLEQVARTFRAAGRVQADEFHLARISSPVTGRVVEIHALEGEFVKRGQVLATLNSTELSNTELTFLEACSRRGLAE
jgi:cobalt-zinc-cadmium efflux system membrane fusion protein